MRLINLAGDLEYRLSMGFQHTIEPTESSTSCAAMSELAEENVDQDGLGDVFQLSLFDGRG